MRTVRKASLSDLNDILGIYTAARAYMAANGNPTQWGKTNPPEELLREDIQNGQLYVLADEKLLGVFALLDGPDPTYGYIEGNWSDYGSYGVIHRIASSGTKRGILSDALIYAFRHYDYLRIDTHENNHTMQHLLEKYGFRRCGIIYLANGDPRIAYDKKK